ncbi:MAG: branched-chain amino acid transport system permease protein [Actinomycetota bacterium]|nr:branched-chain amino acid transport system permease protein [Actinomycetota bacterium]
MSELPQALVNGVLLGAVFALAAVGLTLVFGVMDVVNFAHGEFLMLGMYAGFFAWSLCGLDPMVSFPIAGVVIGLLGLAVYRGAIARVLDGPPLNQVVATFGFMVLLRGAAQFAFSPDTRKVTGSWSENVRFEVGGVIIGGPQLLTAIGAVACTVAVSWFVDRTETGTALRAVGEDRAAAALQGLDVEKLFSLAWVIAGATTGVAGALLMNSYLASPESGVTLGLISFVVVALGGFGSIGGAAAAGLGLGVVQGVVGIYAANYTLAAAMLLFLVVVIVRPQGLVGTR